MIIRRDLLTRMAEIYKQDQLLEKIDRIPLEISNKLDGTERCCVHKARAVVKYKVMAILGFGREEEEDELDTLSSYAGRVVKKEYKPSRYLTVVEEACTSCVKANYVVTNLCKGCIARPCINNCPKKAVAANEQGKAYIDPLKCVNCGICKELCPYHSIIYMPVPCEESCPTGAITKNEQKVESINPEKCILCGKCINACPFGSIIETSQILDVMKLLKEGKEMAAIVAPALFGQYKAHPGAVMDALKKLGFTYVFEAAMGATITTKTEAEEVMHKFESGEKFVATSCCPSWVMAAKKIIPEVYPYVSSTPSPMAITAEIVRKQYPGIPVVFISPCVAKRKEGADNPDIDYVITFEELACLLNGWGISVHECESKLMDETIDFNSRNYCITGGVTKAVNEYLGKEIPSLIINGISKQQLKVIAATIKAREPEQKFIEVMACEGGCISGPSMHEFPKDTKRFFQANIELLRKTDC